MKPLELISILFCILALEAISPAENPSAGTPTPPPGPLVAKTAPDFAQWTITTKSGAADKDSLAGSQKPEKASVVQVVKTGDIRHISIARSNGSKMENWCEGDFQVVTCPEWPLPVLTSGEDVQVVGRIDFSLGDFAGISWIAPKNYVGVRKINGIDCLVFQEAIYVTAAVPMGQSFKLNQNLTTDGADKVPVASATAYVDAKTRLPISIQCGDQITTFTFGTPPTSKLSLPADLQDVIDKWVALKKQNTHVRVHP